MIFTTLKTKRARLCSLLGRERKRKGCDCIFWSLFSGLFVHFPLMVTGCKTNNPIKRHEKVFSPRWKPSHFIHRVLSCVHFASFSWALQLHDISEKSAGSFPPSKTWLFPCKIRDKGLNPVRMRSEFISPLSLMDAHLLLTKIRIPHVRRCTVLSETFIQALIMLTESDASIIC